MGMKIAWPSLKFPPINLWSCPRQDIDFMLREINDIEKCIAKTKLILERNQSYLEFQESVKKVAENELKRREYIYYTRAGKFPDGRNN